MGRRPSAPAPRTIRRGIAIALATFLASCGMVDADRVLHARTARAPPVTALRFGIYPGGPAGTLGPSVKPRPINPGRRLAALERLRGGHPFVLHLYASYSGPRGPSAARQVGREIAGFERAGFEIELVLCYRPARGGSSSQVAGFARFARNAVAALARGRRLVSLQITNEANVAGAADATDGSYGRAEDALIAGISAAKREARALRSSWIAVGFNWAYATGPREAGFWRYLRRRGGAAFDRDVDWVGLDVYPGTWGPPLDAARLGPSTANAMRTAVRSVRRRYMPLAGLSRRVPIHVSENGYPTGPGRSPAMQATVMRAAIEAVEAIRVAYNVTDYRWFDLRDADSASASFEERYGLLYDNYAPKPAFALYRQLIAGRSAR